MLSVGVAASATLVVTSYLQWDESVSAREAVAKHAAAPTGPAAAADPTTVVSTTLAPPPPPPTIVRIVVVTTVAPRASEPAKSA